MREGAVDVSSGDIKAITESVSIPQKIEGPFATTETWLQFSELIDAIGAADDKERNRISLATQLIEKAFLSKGALKFFSYWVALEVAVDKSGIQNIRNLLTKSYQKTNTYIQNCLGLDHIWDTRIAVAHGGESYEMTPDVERYIQCLFLDVVRAKLGLNSKNYMAAMVQDGFNVKRLDRTVTQALILTVGTP